MQIDSISNRLQNLEGRVNLDLEMGQLTSLMTTDKEDGIAQTNSKPATEPVKVTGTDIEVLQSEISDLKKNKKDEEPYPCLNGEDDEGKIPIPYCDRRKSSSDSFMRYCCIFPALITCYIMLVV